MDIFTNFIMCIFKSYVHVYIETIKSHSTFSKANSGLFPAILEKALAKIGKND